jgi:hypothetical protein
MKAGRLPTVEEVAQAYEETGIQPARGIWVGMHYGKRVACPLTTIAIQRRGLGTVARVIAGVDFSQTRVLTKMAKLLRLDEKEAGRFLTAWDNHDDPALAHQEIVTMEYDEERDLSEDPAVVRGLEIGNELRPLALFTSSTPVKKMVGMFFAGVIVDVVVPVLDDPLDGNEFDDMPPDM